MATITSTAPMSGRVIMEIPAIALIGGRSGGRSFFFGFVMLRLAMFFHGPVDVVLRRCKGRRLRLLSGGSIAAVLARRPRFSNASRHFRAGFALPSEGLINSLFLGNRSNPSRDHRHKGALTHAITGAMFG